MSLVFLVNETIITKTLPCARVFTRPFTHKNVSRPLSPQELKRASLKFYSLSNKLAQIIGLVGTVERSTNIITFCENS